tara:strand:- start:564 stop:872 length:309 start_codon:yes stop_codon:yes gene_type:complete
MHEMMRKMMQENVRPFILRQQNFILRQQKIEKNQLALHKQQQLSIEKNNQIVAMISSISTRLDKYEAQITQLYNQDDDLIEQLDALLAMTNHPDANLHSNMH